MKGVNLKWSRERPTELGWYWHKSRRDDEEYIEVVQVRPADRNAVLIRPSSHLSFVKHAGFATDEWAGPVEPPR